MQMAVLGVQKKLDCFRQQGVDGVDHRTRWSNFFLVWQYTPVCLTSRSIFASCLEALDLLRATLEEAMTVGLKTSFW